jgi:hypothetical protein
MFDALGAREVGVRLGLEDAPLVLRRRQLGARGIEGRFLVRVHVQERVPDDVVGVGHEAELVEEGVLGVPDRLDPTLRAGTRKAPVRLLEGVEQLGVSELQALDHIAVELRVPGGLLGFHQRVASAVEPGSSRRHGPGDRSGA